MTQQQLAEVAKMPPGTRFGFLLAKKEQHRWDNQTYVEVLHQINAYLLAHGVSSLPFEADGGRELEKNGPLGAPVRDSIPMDKLSEVSACESEGLGTDTNARLLAIGKNIFSA